MSSNIFISPPGTPLDTGRIGSRVYPDPFVTYATLMLPRNIEDLLRWVDHIVSRQPTYSRALQRIVSYFLTKVEIRDTSDDEKRRYENFLNNTLNVLYQLETIGKDFLYYGNSFTSVYIPFKRYLHCPHCRLERPIAQIDYVFKDIGFIFTCPGCKNRITQKKPIDRNTKDEKNIKIIRWNPHHIKVKWQPISGQSIYLWDPPAEISKQVLAGDKHMLESTPWEMIEAIQAKKMFEFAPNIIFHMKSDAPSGLFARGWGIPMLISVFNQAFYIQMLKMYQEVVCQEYILPMRAVFPAKPNGPTDPMIHTNIGQANSKILGMLKEHRRRPGGWYALPIPVDYKTFGGEGLNIDVEKLLTQAIDEMLNACGVPAEFYKATLQVQAAPMALRLFQQTWGGLTSQMNNWLKWLLNTLSPIMNWQPADIVLQPVTLADDVENKHILLQLAAGNKISMEKALAPFNIDPNEDLRRIFAEQRQFQDAQNRFQKETETRQNLLGAMQQGQQQGAPGGQPGAPQDPLAGGGGPADPMQSPSVTPDQMMSQAEQMAQQFISMPYEIRKSKLIQLKRSNETLHALVVSKMGTVRNQAKTEGGYQVLAQQSQQGPPAQA